MTFTKIMFGFLLTAMLGSSIFLAFAATGKYDVQLQIPLPGKETITACKEVQTGTNLDGTPIMGLNCTGLADYIVKIYEWLVRAAAILAAAMITWGGFQWLSAAGESKRVEEGKKTMHNALIGLVLALGSYTLLWAINPDLVKFNAFDLSLIKPKQVLFEVDAATKAMTAAETTMAHAGRFGSSEATQTVPGYANLKFTPRAVADMQAGVINQNLKDVLSVLDQSGVSLSVNYLKTDHTASGSLHGGGMGVDLGASNLVDFVTAANYLHTLIRTKGTSPSGVSLMKDGKMIIREMFFCDDRVRAVILNDHHGGGALISQADFKKKYPDLCAQHTTHLHIGVIQ